MARMKIKKGDLVQVISGRSQKNGGDDNVTDAGVTTTRTTENTDAKDLLGTGVVGDTQSRLLLDHCLTPVVALVLISEPCGTDLWSVLVCRMPASTAATRHTGDSELLGAIENLHHAPVLGGRERAGLHDQDPVADRG